MNAYLAELTLTADIGGCISSTQRDTLTKYSSKDVCESCLLEWILIIRERQTVLDTELCVGTDERSQACYD